MRLGLPLLGPAAARPVAAGTGAPPPPPAAGEASIVGIKAVPTSGAHTAKSVPHDQGAGHGLLVFLLTRPQAGGGQEATVTWQGAALDPLFNTSDALSAANDPVLQAHRLAAPAAGLGNVEVAFATTHSDSLVVVVETANADLAAAVATAREGDAPGTELSAEVTGTGLGLAVGGISLGTTVAWSTGWTEVLEAKSDEGTSTSTLTGGVASRRAAGATPATVTFGGADDGRVLGLLVLPDA